MDIKEERKAFEIWYCRNHTGLKQSDLAKFRTLSGYSFSDSLKINISWEAWQAAKAQAVPEGFVLVPKEPTDKTIAHMINTPIEVNLLCDHADTFLSEGEAYIAYQAMIEAQEQSHE